MTNALSLSERFDVSTTPAADENPALVYLARLMPESRPTMRAALATIARLITGEGVDPLTLPWHQLEYQHVQGIRTRLAERFAPATCNKLLAALRGVLKESWRLGLMSAEAYHRAADVEGVKGSRIPAGRGLSVGELRALFQVCGEDPVTASGARDAALLAILYGCGLRRSEAVALTLEDFDRTTGAVKVRSGKGRKDRVVYLNADNGGGAALSFWLELRGADPGPLVCPVNKSGRVVLRRMTAQSVLYILRRRALEAHVASFTPHDLRRSCASDLLDAGADLVSVQGILGHASPTTTARYDRRGERAKAAAAGKLHIPFARPCC